MGITAIGKGSLKILRFYVKQTIASNFCEPQNVGTYSNKMFTLSIMRQSFTAIGRIGKHRKKNF